MRRRVVVEQRSVKRVARNTAAASGNPVHDPVAAIELGLAGPLVSGVTLYAYLAEAAAEQLGDGLFDSGVIEARFRVPVVDGELLELSAEARGGQEATVRAVRSDGEVVAVAEASLGGTGTVPWVSRDFEPDTPVDATREALSGAGSLRSLTTTLTTDLCAEIAAAADAFAWPPHRVHPATLVDLANGALMQAVELDGWIHARSRVSHYRRLLPDETLTLHPSVLSLGERPHGETAVIELVAEVEGVQVARLEHDVIYRLAAN